MLTKNSIDFYGNLYCTISTVRKRKTWKGTGILSFQESIGFHEFNLTQCLIFFSGYFVAYITTSGIDWKTAEKWDLAHTLWDKIYLNML